MHVVASLPCYSPKNVNMQRGSGVFDRSIKGLLELNAQGYGEPETGLKLDLVYNPLGGFLPPEQVYSLYYSVYVVMICDVLRFSDTRVTGRLNMLHDYGYVLHICSRFVLRYDYDLHSDLRLRFGLRLPHRTGI